MVESVSIQLLFTASVDFPFLLPVKVYVSHELLDVA